MAEDLAAHAARLLEHTAYLALGTITPDGRPWVSPVYFAAEGLTDFYWSSSTDSRHSQNLAENAAVSLVVFDSTVAPYHGRAVYAEGTAGVVPPEELGRALAVYPGRAGRGGGALTEDDVTGSSPWRLYRARVRDVWVLCPRDPQQPCALHGRRDDHRARVELRPPVAGTSGQPLAPNLR